MQNDDLESILSRVNGRYSEPLSEKELALIRIASQAGANSVLHELGLDNEEERKKFRTSLELADSYSHIRSEALKVVVKWAVGGLLAAMAIGTAIKFKLFGG